MEATKAKARPRTSITLAVAVGHYVSKVGDQPWKRKGATTIQGSPIGDLKLSRLTTRALREWCESRLDHVCLASVQNELRMIRLAYEAARDDFGLKLPPANPAIGIVLNEKDRKLTHAELERLSEALADKPIVRALVIVAAATGLSRGALSGLQWRDVELDHAVVHLRDRSEGKIVRSVLLSPQAVEVLMTLDHTSRRVFPIPVERVKWAWMAACRRVGVKGLRFFDARHVLQYEGRLIRT